MPAGLNRRRVWVFDLDHTLYPPSARLFEHVNQRIVEYVEYIGGALRVDSQHADRLRQAYWQEYGTTLAGLMEVHGIDPDPYLDAVHDIPLDSLHADSDLRGAIAALPGRKIVHTNGAAPYARRVLAARGLEDLFDAVYGIEHADYRPKPEAAAFETILKRDRADPRQAVMFEDDARNLRAPHAMGMATVHVAPQAEPQDHIAHHTDDLTGFLRRIVDPDSAYRELADITTTPNP